MAPAHREARLRAHQYHMHKEDIAGLHQKWITFIKHRKINPNRIIGSPHPITTRIESRMRKPMAIENTGMCIKHISHWRTRFDRVLASNQRFNSGSVHAYLCVVCGPNHKGSHHRRMIPTPRPRPFQRQLICLV